VPAVTIAAIVLSRLRREGHAEGAPTIFDRKATSISLLVVLGVREDGQKVLLAVKSEGASYCP